MKKIILVLLVTAAVPAAFASSIVTIKFTGLPATYESGSYGGAGATFNGAAYATLDGETSLNLVCDDFVSSTTVPSDFMDFTAETIPSLAGVRFNSGYATISDGGVSYTLTTTQAYQTAAVLLSWLLVLPTDGSHANAITDYQYAIWDLMNPGATDPGTGTMDSSDLSTPDVQRTAFAAVRAATADAIAAENALVIYTPTAQFASNQEFLGMNTPTGVIPPPTGTPEPSTWLLMAGLSLSLCLPSVRLRLKSAVLPKI